MTVSTADLQVNIIDEVGEVWEPSPTPGGSPVALLASRKDVMWDRAADQGQNNAGLQALYFKRACIDRVLGRGGIAGLTDFAVFEDLTSKQSQRFQHLTQMRADVQAEIIRVEAQLQLAGGAAVGTIAAAAIRSREDAWNDPVNAYPEGNDPRYRGDVYSPAVRW